MIYIYIDTSHTHHITSHLSYKHKKTSIERTNEQRKEGHTHIHGVAKEHMNDKREKLY